MRTSIALTLFALAAAFATDAPTLDPKDLAARLATSHKPVILQVGFAYQYRLDHIPGAIYAGPASRPAGLDALKAAVAKLPREGEIVLYCGCCPWDRCPNIKPAIEMLKRMGFIHVIAMRIPSNFKADWVDQNYPVEHSDSK
jgi:thiosulfate/3-mercaptopyruvate sulfurtransferase